MAGDPRSCCGGRRGGSPLDRAGRVPSQRATRGPGHRGTLGTIAVAALAASDDRRLHVLHVPGHPLFRRRHVRHAGPRGARGRRQFRRRTGLQLLAVVRGGAGPHGRRPHAATHLPGRQLRHHRGSDARTAGARRSRQVHHHRAVRPVRLRAVRARRISVTSTCRSCSPPTCAPRASAWRSPPAASARRPVRSCCRSWWPRMGVRTALGACFVVLAVGGFVSHALAPETRNSALDATA